MSFFAWQIELTTKCALRCRMCIRDSYKDLHSVDMPIDEFRKLAPYLKNVKHVVLEGWGEPLLYKDLIEAIRISKGAGSRPGFITSGWGLTGDYISDLIKGGLDFIGFSLAGATSETHDSIRINSHLPDILQAIREFNRIKSDNGLDRPALHIVYLMLKDNLAEIPLLLDLAKRLGIEVVVLMNPVEVTNDWQNSRKVFTCGNEEVNSVLEEAKIKAEELKIALKMSCLSPNTLAVCEEDPINNLFISVDGQVAPCVYLYPPTSSPIKRIYRGNDMTVEKVSFGNIFSGSLETIWNSKEYVAFRQAFKARKEMLELSHFLHPSIALDAGRLSGTAVPDPPEACGTCHRMLGI